MSLCFPYSNPEGNPSSLEEGRTDQLEFEELENKFPLPSLFLLLWRKCTGTKKKKDFISSFLINFKKLLQIKFQIITSRPNKSTSIWRKNFPKEISCIGGQRANVYWQGCHFPFSFFFRFIF